MSGNEQDRAATVAYRSPHGVEQDRRDFMRDHPDLYAYICNRVAAKVLGEAGDAISGHHEAANRVWAMSARYEHERRAQAGASGERCPTCRHAKHGAVCLNMASDNDCACRDEHAKASSDE